MHVSSVKTIVANAKRNGHTHSKLRTGRPRKTSVREDRQIVREAKKNRRLSAEKIATMVEEDHGVTISNQTVRNRIKEEGFNGRAARKKPNLSKQNMKARLAYAMTMLKYKEKDWRKVVFSDESSIWLTGAAGRVYVWRKPGEEFKRECLVPTFKSGRETLMVWGCITYEGVGALHLCETSVTGTYYKSILEKNLQATVSVMGIGDDYKFVHDGAPAHRSKLIKNYLKENKVEVLEHPAQSPDLNPIENLWAHVKQELHKAPASSIEDLKLKIQAIWYVIESERVQKLYLSMAKRLQQVKVNKGGHTKY